ncbi:unnamed protein product [Peniophora sp. CBMAI 1063]|nr:unnamed protein product [Peniophora sp. CBMAI 1063]
MSVLPPPFLPIEIIQEFARCVLYLHIAAAFDAYAPPGDLSLLRPVASQTRCTDPCQDPTYPTCIQDGVHAIHSASRDDRRVDRIHALVVEQVRGARCCVKRPTARALFQDARKLILVSKTWRDAVSQDPQLWPRDEESKFLPYAQAQRVLFPARGIRNDNTTASYLALDPLCSCAFNSLHREWLSPFTHVSIALPRLCCKPGEQDSYGSLTFINHIAHAQNLTYIELRCAFPTSIMDTEGGPLIMPHLEVARLINCEYLLSGPKLRVLYFTAFFSEVLPLEYLLEGLAHSPALEVLHIRTADFLKVEEEEEDGTEDPHIENSLPPAVALPHLRHLSLSLAPDAHSKLFHMLDLLPEVEVHLEGARGGSTYTDIELGLRQLVPSLFMPGMARQVVQNGPSFYMASGVPDQLGTAWRQYPVIGFDIGLDRSRKGDAPPSRYPPEFVRVILAGEIEDALRGMLDASQDAAAITRIPANHLPRRSLSSRRHSTRVYALGPSWDTDTDAIRRELLSITSSLRLYKTLRPGATLVLGTASYIPRSPIEWYRWLANCHPRALVIPGATTGAGREPISRGVMELEALATLLRDGIKVENKRRWIRRLKSISVSSACLGERPQQELTRLTRIGTPSKDVLAKYGLDAVEWCFYEDKVFSTGRYSL